MLYLEIKSDGRYVFTNEKIRGLNYASEAETEKLARENYVGAIRGFDGTVLAESIYYMSDAEKKLVGEQVIRRGPHEGKKLSEVPELFAVTINPDFVAVAGHTVQTKGATDVKATINGKAAN